MADILARKERERCANDGVFLWGIGNAVGPGITELLRKRRRPPVLFSPIKSPPRRDDCSPARVVAWTSAETMEGNSYVLPPGSIVTSRLDPDRPKPCHYALVCYSEGAIVQEIRGQVIHNQSLRNLTTGSPVGSSQVTAVVSVDRDSSVDEHGQYPVAWRAVLEWPYFIRLTCPLDISLDRMLEAVHAESQRPVSLADCS